METFVDTLGDLESLIRNIKVRTDEINCNLQHAQCTEETKSDIVFINNNREETNESEPFMWIPLPIGSMITVGSNVLRFEEDLGNEVSVDQGIKIGDEEFCAQSLVSCGIVLDRVVTSVVPHLSKEGLATVLCKVFVKNVTPIQLRRARMQGSGKIYPGTHIIEFASRELRLMAREDELSQKARTYEIQQQLMQKKARELQRKTKLRLQEKQKEETRKATLEKELDEKKMELRQIKLEQDQQRVAHSLKLAKRRVREQKKQSGSVVEENADVRQETDSSTYRQTVKMRLKDFNNHKKPVTMLPKEERKKCPAVETNKELQIRKEANERRKRQRAIAKNVVMDNKLKYEGLRKHRYSNQESLVLPPLKQNLQTVSFKIVDSVAESIQPALMQPASIPKCIFKPTVQISSFAPETRRALLKPSTSPCSTRHEAFSTSYLFR